METSGKLFTFFKGSKWNGFKMGHAIIFQRLPCLQPCHYLLSGVKNHMKSESLYFQVFPVFLCLIMAKSKTRKSDENDRFFCVFYLAFLSLN